MTDIINIGAFSNDGTGDPARVAFAKINAWIASANAGALTPPIYIVAGLPTPVLIGTDAIVTDALGPTYLAPVVGGGNVLVRVMWNGTKWICS